MISPLTFLINTNNVTHLTVMESKEISVVSDNLFLTSKLVTLSIELEAAKLASFLSKFCCNS